MLFDYVACPARMVRQSFARMIKIATLYLSQPEEPPFPNRQRYKAIGSCVLFVIADQNLIYSIPVQQHHTPILAEWYRGWCDVVAGNAIRGNILHNAMNVALRIGRRIVDVSRNRGEQ